MDDKSMGYFFSVEIKIGSFGVFMTFFYELCRPI